MFKLFFIILISSEIRFTGASSPEETPPLVTIRPDVTLENLSRRTISSICLFLSLLAFSLIFTESTRLFGLIIFCGVLVFAVSAEDEVNPDSTVVKESKTLIDQKILGDVKQELARVIDESSKTELKLNESLLLCKQEKEEIQKKVELLRNMISNCTDSKLNLEIEIDGLKAELKVKEELLKNKTKEIELLKEKKDCEERTVTSDFQFVTLKQMKDRNVAKLCLNKGEFNFSQVLSILHPDLFNVEVDSIISTDYELEETTKYYLDSVIQRLKKATDIDQFYLVVSGIFNHYKKYVSNCRSAIIALNAFRYFEKHVEPETMTRMLTHYSGNSLSTKSNNLFKQSIHFVQTFFYVVEPIKYQVGPVHTVTILLSLAIIWMLVNNTGRIRRRTGDAAAVLIGMACVCFIIIAFWY